jgi:hypothetical protein
MKTIVVVLTLSAVALGIGILLYRKREGYIYNNVSTSKDRCKSHCFENNSGEIMDDYDCCECMATVTGSFEPNFHSCMCSVGQNDYCYKPVTNFLLSQ